jgi:hypothetical protein
MRAAAVVLSVCAAGGLWAQQEQRYTDWASDPASQMIFHAVLEGLYTDGMSNDDVDCVIPIDPKSGSRNFAEHFVYSCPLCHPAYEAFVMYRGRPEFSGRKGTKDSFGTGLDAAISARLHDKDVYVRRRAIGKLIEGWVQTRLESMRLTEAERASWGERLVMLRKQGMDALFKNQLATYKDKGCAVCDACVRGGEKAWSLTSLTAKRSAKQPAQPAATPPPPPTSVKPPKTNDEQF